MDMNLQSSPRENAYANAAFRKPSNDAANRKYRRRSPLSGSSSSDGSPHHGPNISPVASIKDSSRASEDYQRKDGGRDIERDYGRSKYSQNDETYRHSDRHSSRNSYDYHRRDDRVRRGNHADDDDGRENAKLSSRSGRESKDGTHSDRMRRESDHNRPTDYQRNVDKSSRGKTDGSGHRSRDREKELLPVDYKKYKDKDSSSDRIGSGRRHPSFSSEHTTFAEQDRHKRDRDGRYEKGDYRRSLGEIKSDYSPSYEEFRGHPNYSTSQRDSSGHRLKEASKDMDNQRYPEEGNIKYKDQETNEHKEEYTKEQEQQFGHKAKFSFKDEESPAKKRMLSNLDGGTNNGGDGYEKLSSSSRQAQDIVCKKASEQAYLKQSDVDAAKIAAIKAAELVNRNLIGTGVMTADQKKKLLWGKKKSTPTEESAHRWDPTMFGDRERQEKFSKLMGMKGDVNVDHKAQDQVQAEKQKELQIDLEKQYTAGLRRRDGRTVGLGL